MPNKSRTSWDATIIFLGLLGAIAWLIFAVNRRIIHSSAPCTQEIHAPR